MAGARKLFITNHNSRGTYLLLSITKHLCTRLYKDNRQTLNIAAYCSITLNLHVFSKLFDYTFDLFGIRKEFEHFHLHSLVIDEIII